MLRIWGHFSIHHCVDLQRRDVVQLRGILFEQVVTEQTCSYWFPCRELKWRLSLFWMISQEISKLERRNLIKWKWKCTHHLQSYSVYFSEPSLCEAVFYYCINMVNVDDANDQQRLCCHDIKITKLCSKVIKGYSKHCKEINSCPLPKHCLNKIKLLFGQRIERTCAKFNLTKEE